MRNALHLNVLTTLMTCALLCTVSHPMLDAPVADAAMRGDRAAVQALIRSGADVNLAQGDGMTALHWAAELGDADMARMLLVAGANAAATTRIGDFTPLHVAAQEGSGEVVKALLDAGADPSPRRSGSGTTPLHFAAGAGDVQSIDALIEHGADVDVRELEWGQTPLMFAAEKNRVDAVHALLAHGADVSITTRVLDVTRRAAQDVRARKVRTE